MWMLLKPILGMLRAIPWWAYALAACLAWGGWQRHRANAVAARFQAAQADAAAERERALAETIAETARRLAAQQAVARNADAQLVKARASAAAASAAAAGLRERLAAIQAGARAGDPAAAGAGAADRLADLLDRCADRYQSVAARADAAVIAGLACEQSYESLSSQPAGDRTH